MKTNYKKVFSVMGTTLIIVAVAMILGGCQYIKPYLPKPTPTPTPPTPTPEPHPVPAPSGSAWPSLSAPSFFQHGNEDENTYRQRAINATRTNKLDCIRCRADFGMGDELAMHLLALEHPSKPGYYLEQDSWFFQAERQGVTRWIHDLGTPTMAQAERWLWLTKSPYYKGRLQYLCSKATAADVIAKLKGNAQGCEVLVE
jgi:hypothetical protein